MICDTTREALRSWSPDTDLPDAIALHLDDCELCMQAFDQRFPPPQEHRSRWRPWRVLAAAAVLALAVGLAPLGSVPVDDTELPVCIDLEVWLPPECLPT
jgi:hypothetical protein